MVTLDVGLLSLSEKACLKKLSEKYNPLLFLLLLRCLGRGDTALHAHAPSQILSEIIETDQAEKIVRELFQRKDVGSLCIDEDVAAFPKWAAMEQFIAQNIVQRMSLRQKSLLIPALPELLNDGQKQALCKALVSPIFFMTGGPGTGKTHTAGLYLKTQLQQGKFGKVYLLAPTGKAVKTLEKSIQKALVQHHGSCSIHAMTLHSFLAQGRAPLVADAVLIDESSMIDTRLMYLFLEAVDISTPLFFLGDADQLPPIEPGQPFADIVEFLEQQKSLCVHRLSQCQRTDSLEILQLARAIAAGGAVDLASYSQEVQFVPTYSTRDWQRAEQLWQQEVFAPWMSVVSMDEARLLSSRQVVLTAERKGLSGSLHLIRRAEEMLHLKKSTYAPVLVARNSYDLGVMNGDVGLLDRSCYSLDVCHFSDKSIPLILLDRWEFAYAMTVHKSQGSEYNKVNLLLTSSKGISKKLLYTAVTRARSFVRIFGDEKIIDAIIRTPGQRMTALPVFLKRAL